MRTPFTGVGTALITPFDNGGVDEEAFQRLVGWQIEQGTNGLVPVGTTGDRRLTTARGLPADAGLGQLGPRAGSRGARAPLEELEPPAVDAG